MGHGVLPGEGEEKASRLLVIRAMKGWQAQYGRVLGS